MKSGYQFEPSEILSQEKLSADLLQASLLNGLKKRPIKKEWQQRVYKKNKDDKYGLFEFNILCKYVFKRDKHICQACFKTKRKLALEDGFLTAHHIIPRIDGGDNYGENLITLCNYCHDKIEELNIKTKEEIYGFFTESKNRWNYKENIGVNWKQWVYGGMKRP